MTETVNNISRLDELIGQLPDSFPAAAEIIKCEIATLINACHSGVKDHYIKIIKKKTKAESVKSVSLLIEDALRESEASESETDDIEQAPPPDEDEIRELAIQIALDPFLFIKKIDMVTGLGVINERRNIGVTFLVIDSRLVPMGPAESQALALKNSGHYGAGKSYQLFSSAKLYSNKAIYIITSGSEKSLYSLNNLTNMALIITEAQALETQGGKDSELAFGLRSLISEGFIKYQYSAIVGGKRTTVVNWIKGPASLITTTVKGRLEEQLDDRMITIHPNTSAEQTKHIIRQTAQNACGKLNPVDDKLIRAYRHFHDSLLSIEVIIVFAPQISDFIDLHVSLPISARRAFKRVLSGIKTMTLIHQKQRCRDEQGRLIAEYVDYHLVHQLLEKSFSENLGKIERHTDTRIMLIEGSKRITPKILAEKTGVSVPAISQWMKPLIEKGTLEWCDENSLVFANSESLEKAKRSGKAFIQVAGGKCLPTTYELTGDPRWDKNGELYQLYDLKLDEEGGDQGITEIEKVDSTEPVATPDSTGNEAEGVKVLSGKSEVDLKKMISDFQKEQKEFDPNAPEVIELENEFEGILSNKTNSITFAENGFMTL